jgi:hypothetical protein
MTQPTFPDLNKRCAAASLTRPTRQVHLAVLATFAETGRPPARSELEHIARSTGSGPAAVLAELTGRDVIAFGTDGEIRGLPVLSGTYPGPGDLGRRAGHLRHVRHRRARHLRHALPPGHDHRR